MCIQTLYQPDVIKTTAGSGQKNIHHLALISAMLFFVCCCFQITGAGWAAALPSSRAQKVEAGRLQLEGTRLQLKGDIARAVKKYRESLALKPDAQLEDLVKRLEKRLQQPDTAVTRQTGPVVANPSQGWRVNSISFPVSSSINDTCTSPSGTYAVTDDSIFHFDGKKWTAMKLPDIAGGLFFETVECISDNDIYAAGKYIFHYDGTTWQKIIEPENDPSLWSAIWHDRKGNIVLGGDEDISILSPSGAWTPVKTGLHSGDNITGIWGENINNFFAVGGTFDSGFILQCEAQQCQQLQTVKDKKWLYGIYGRSENDIYAVGDGVIFHYNGSAWAPMQVPQGIGKLTSIAGREQTIIAAGGHGNVAQLMPNGWQSLHCPYKNLLIGSFWWTSDNILHLSGRGASLEPVLVAYNNRQWQLDNPRLQDVIVLPDSSIYAVGAFGTIKTWADGHWQTMESNTTEDLAAIWGSSHSNIYAVDVHATLMHFDGVSWKKVDESMTQENPWPASIWGSGPDNIYIMTDNSELYHFNGKQSSYLNAPFDDMDQVGMISGSSATNIYAAGTAVYHFDGTTWTKIKLPEKRTYPFADMTVTSDGQLALVYANTLYLYNGADWTTVVLPPRDSKKGLSLTSLWGTSLSDIYVTGYEDARNESEQYEGFIAHYDGKQWQFILNLPGETPLSISGQKEADVFVGGSGLTGIRRPSNVSAKETKNEHE